jgi:hypothetical protein
MGIENLKRWHWCVIGVFLGAVVAGIKLWSGVAETPRDGHASPFIFEEQALRHYDPISRHAVVKVDKIVVHPPDNLPVPGERTIPTEFVTYDAWIQDPKDHTKMFQVPFKLVMQLPSAGKNKSILGEVATMAPREYLDKVLAEIPKLDKRRFDKAQPFNYRYAWIETPRVAFSVYCIGGFILIGIIWPSLVDVLRRAGYGRGDVEKEFDLSRFKGGKAEPGKKTAGVTQADMDELARIEAELEAKLRAGTTESTDVDAPAAPAKAAPAPVKVLSAGPVELAKPEAVPEPAPRKGYGADQGDYYPTEVHGKKKD